MAKKSAVEKYERTLNSRLHVLVVGALLQKFCFKISSGYGNSDETI